MLALVLTVASVDGAAPPQPLSVTIPVTGGAIGRDSSNTLALPDAFSRVSRVHAMISFPAGYATISNASLTLPLRVGDVDLVYRESVLLVADDTIEIGPYIIRALFVERSVDTKTQGPRTDVRYEQRTVRRTAISAVRLSAAIRQLDEAVEHVGGPPHVPSPASQIPLSAVDTLSAANAQSESTPVSATLIDPLTVAFLEGARLAADSCGTGLTAETMQIIGTCLRAATAGAIDLLAARAITKFQVQADVTVFAERANNPFKFMPDADSVMLLALGKKVPGFMRPDAAMRDTFADLRAHEAGVIAGTRAAVVAALERFAPEALSAQLSSGSVVDRLFPSLKRAQLWGLYTERYQGIAARAEQDFYGVFGTAFVDAYREETQREANLVAMRKAHLAKSG